MDYFLQYQGKVSLIVLAVSVIFIPIYYSRLDKKMKDSGMDLDKIKEYRRS